MRAAASAKSADLLGKKDSAGFVCRLANSTARKSLIVSKDSRIMDFPKAPSIAEQGRECTTLLPNVMSILLSYSAKSSTCSKG